MKRSIWTIGAFSLLLIGCTRTINGPVSVQAIRSVGHCQYSTDLVTIDTLSSLEPLQGQLGSFVYTPKTFSTDQDFYLPSFNYLETRFQYSGSGYYAKDYLSLVGASTYYYLEQIQKMFAAIDPKADLKQVVTNLPDTLIYYRAAIQSSSNFVNDTDNAAYLKPTPLSYSDTRNFLFLYPNQEISDVPLGLNPGVIGHEATHFVSQYLWRKFTDQAGLSDYASRVLGSVDEGFSDYAGFLLSGDAGFFTCSFPSENRDLAIAKRMSSVSPGIAEENYDIHAGGAVWASVQYQIGQIVGHSQNLRALVQMFANLQSCGLSNLTFTELGRCHINNLGSGNSQVQQIYSNAFGGF